MKMVLLTALGVGGATVIGAVLGFVFKHISHRFSDWVLAFAAGVMLAVTVSVAVMGVLMPLPVTVTVLSMVLPSAGFAKALGVA